MNAWQPMSTAPEHEPILVWVPGVNSGLDSAEVVIIIRDADDPSGRGYSMWTNGGPNGGSDVDLEHEPTHWQPIEPPSEVTIPVEWAGPVYVDGGSIGHTYEYMMPGTPPKRTT
jgi:hypothetical protein